ncbi:hypothetical protein AVEN_77724-1 [Araneus ventricosus]|uniref:CCHC-type domain-containing protein n=1 Tax=Araneus ventricosus TaxID=182803 RepID=A0A4Y2SNA8_ARAVE|nr:hypothetical protein AVEN_77724-1 [Araneus ventricosus]
MTKRKPEGVDEGSVKDRRINFIHINEISIVDKATAAFQNGIPYVKLCIDSTSGASPWIKPTVINATFGPITQSDDIFSINKNKKLIFATRHLSSVQKVTKFVNSVQNANVRLIDTNIVTKYIIRDVDTDLFIEDIAAELTKQSIAASKIVRFKKKGTSEPIPIVLLEEIGRTNRSDIRIGRLIFKVYKFIENPKLCYKCLKFGHTQIRCRNDKRCKNCGGAHNECSDVPVKCFRCGQAHDALSKECSLGPIHGGSSVESGFEPATLRSLGRDLTTRPPRPQECSFFLIEKEIINLVRDNDISFNEARKKVNSQTYAQTVRKHSSEENSVKSGQEIADLREAVKELSNIVSNLTPKVNDIAKLQEVNRQCVGRIAEIQINLDRQVEENINLKKHIEIQRATIESLQSKIAVLESNFEYNPIPSPIVGDDQRTLADLNHQGNFNIHHPALGSSHTSTDAISVLDWIGIRHTCVLNLNRFTRYQGTHAPCLLDLSICSAEIVNNISLEVSHDMYDSDHCPILLSLLNFGIKSKVTRKYINWSQFSERINDNLCGTDNLSSIEDLTHFFKISAGSSSYSFTRSTHSSPHGGMLNVITLRH